MSELVCVSEMDEIILKGYHRAMARQQTLEITDKQTFVPLIQLYWYKMHTYSPTHRNNNKS